MKKLFALLLAVVMVLSLVACGEKEPSADNQNNTTDTYEIVMLMDLPGGSVDDGSFCEATWDGIEKYCAETGATSTYMTPAEESKESYLSLIDQAIAAGGKVLVCPGYLFEDAISEAQDKHPETKFILIDGRPHSSDYTTYRTGDNVYSVLFAEQEVGFMAGYASVMEGYRNLAFFGGMAVTSVARFGYGYVCGAEQAAKDLGLAAGEVNMIYWYSGDFMASPEKLTTVKGWYETGTEVVFSCGGTICESAFAAAEELGKAVIGVDLDQAGDSSSVITSAMKGCANATYDALIGYKNGNFPGGQDAVLGAAVDCVGLATGDSWRLQNYTEEQYQELYERLKNDVDGIASSIPTDADIEDPTQIPLELVNLDYKN
ncbi:MAG: BMP family ABC transporter substrate-binding protein [Oscillospiraceae bacterium]|nr:BMP family ABC transporter substrate-binding protein [Oscillospiraceae bacterium]